MRKYISILSTQICTPYIFDQVQNLNATKSAFFINSAYKQTQNKEQPPFYYLKLIINNIKNTPFYSWKQEVKTKL